MTSEPRPSPTTARLSIPGRIAAGFALMIAIVIALAATGILAGREARTNSGRFSRVTSKVFVILELRREVVELQRSVQVFAHTGHESLAEDARMRMTTLQERSEAAEALVTDARAVELLERMKVSLQTYEATLSRAVTERRVRYDLVRTRTEELDRTLAGLMEGVADAELTARDRRLLAVYATVRGDLFRYLVDPDVMRLEEARSAIEAARAMRPDEAPDGERQRAVVEVLDQYEKTFTRIVQSTRGYLYLVGVVMAGEAAETTYLASQLTEVALANVPTILGDLEGLAESSTRRGLIAGALALALALALSWGIARSISGPLSNITDTLRRLAAGQPVEHVPGIERGDEIGIMAQAADAFRRQNDRTEALLSEAQELTAALDDKKDELERSNGELEQFVYTVSHDLKSPLVTSQGFIGMIRELADRGEIDLALSKLDVLERANRRMSQLISDLLSLSRVGRSEDDSTLLAPSPIVEDIVDSLSKSLSESGCRVIVQPDMPAVLGHRTRFAQVIDNLLTNAIKYGKPDDGEFIVEVGGQLEAQGVVRLFVRDHGPGIAPEHQRRVFGLFQRLSAKGAGTGIGLAIVDKIMTAAGGSATIESTGQGDGCTFWLVFPGGDARTASTAGPA